jgi:hypothetical protein
MKNLKIYQLFCVIFFLNSSYLISDTIYRWVDENGVKNFSNFPANVPDNFFKNNRASIQISDSESSLLKGKRIFKIRDEIEEELAIEKKQRERLLIIGKIKELVYRETYLQEQLVAKKDTAIRTKREFDKLIINGYFADHSILELRRLDREMTEISGELQSIKPTKQKLVALAMQRGISKRYFRN